jgi:hypothetical protein
VCSCGVSSSPLVAGQTHHFAARGLYNGMLVLGDSESGSFWDHLTGECVHGPLRGNRLEGFPLLHTTAGQMLDALPDAHVAISILSAMQRALALVQAAVKRSLGGRLPPGFARTMGEEDQRRPRMERGLAVWTDRANRFYSLDALRAHGDALIDDLDELRLLVCIDRTSGSPASLFTDATAAIWQEDTLHLDTGEVVRGGIGYDAQHAIRVTPRPMQSILCWYAFAFTFPGGEVWEG